MPLPTLIMLASWATFLIVWFVSAFGIKRDVRGSRFRGEMWSRIAFTAVFFMLLWIASRLAMGSSFATLRRSSLPLLVQWIGAILTVGGLVIAVWARRHLGRNWSPAPALKEEHELVTSGPYKLVRHPIYTGLLVMILGTTLINLTALISLVFAIVLFVWRVGAEEKLMMQQFPNTYSKYKEHTWALIPYVW